MAKAKYHKAQRVYVKPVGTWGYVEQIVPKWVSGVEEPIRIHYDVGMGREFAQDELEPGKESPESEDGLRENPAQPQETLWRIVRGSNKWKERSGCGHHPFPGTHPVIVTTQRDWGGWRVPGAEYDRNPELIERQARLMSKAPMLAALLYEFVEDASMQEENLPDSTLQLARLAHKVLLQVD